MTEDVKNFYTVEDEAKFQEAYRLGRARELLERIRWRQKPPSGLVFDKDGKPTLPDDLPELSYWRLFFAGKAPKLGEDDEQAVTRIERKLLKGTSPDGIDLYNLEQAYCRLNPMFADESGELERRATEFIVRTAKEEVAAGRFENLEIALRSYGLQREAEEARHV